MFINERLGIPVYSAVFAFFLSAFWMIVHYVTLKQNLLPNSDISEISIAMSYVAYILIYYYVFTLYRKGEIKSFWVGVMVPLLATIGGLIIIFGGVQNILFGFYAAFCILVFLGSFLYAKIAK